MNSYPRLKSGVRIERELSPATDGLFVGLPTRGVRLFHEQAELVIRSFTGTHSIVQIADSLLIPHGDVAAIVSALANSGLLELWPHGAPTPGSGIGNQYRAAQYEIQRDLITHRNGSTDGGVQEMELRAQFTILISGENRLARTLLTLLQSMGVIHTRIITRGHLAARVDSFDVCGFTTRMSDVGKIRSEFHQELIRESELPFSHAYSAKATPDLIISTIPVEWDYVQRWMSEGSAHLHINSMIGGAIELGPYVIPGRSACLRCVALSQRDAHIPIGDGALRKELPAAASAQIAGVIAAIVGELIATGASELLGSSFWLNLLQPLAPIERRYWQPHPECGCSD